jgi:hypothetical protein
VKDPLSPLTPNEIAQQEAEAAKEGWLRRSLVAFDIACNVIFLRGRPDETISSHAGRAAIDGKLWGKLLAKALNLFEDNHCEHALAGDLERAQAIEKTEKEGLDKTWFQQ